MALSLLTKHAQALILVADDCDIRMHDLADQLGVTERAAYSLVCDLVSEGYVSRERKGRCNCYHLHLDRLRAADDPEPLMRLVALLGSALVQS